MMYDKPITVEVEDLETGERPVAWRLHARVNKAGGGQAYNAGADQYTAALTFEVRYFADLEALRYSPQLYHIVYRGHTFKVTDYDDYMEQHRTVRLTGEAYG